MSRRRFAALAVGRGKGERGRLSFVGVARTRKANTVVLRHRSCPCRSRWREPSRLSSGRRSEVPRSPAAPYVIRARADGTLLGGTGLAFVTPYRASTGYVLAKAAWGKGYATEALRAMV